MAIFKTRILSIGNSRVVRIPKALLDRTGLRSEVEISVQAGGLLLRSAARPRAGWDEAFRAMAELGDDRLFDGEVHTPQSPFASIANHSDSSEGDEASAR